MRTSIRLLAIVSSKNHPTPKNPGQYLIAHNPTGLTGITTHPFPRPTLLRIYSQTLSKLSAFPPHSIYRQSVENLTKHRLAIISAALPPGFAEWQTRLKEQIAAHPEIVEDNRSFRTAGGEVYMIPREEDDEDDREEEWNGEDITMERGEGPRTLQERAQQARELGEGEKVEEFQAAKVEVENEPPLTIDQITSIENEIGAGLIEEVIAVAQGELELVDHMLESKVWEELEEKPVEGQWSYFQRDRNVGVTQAP